MNLFRGETRTFEEECRLREVMGPQDYAHESTKQSAVFGRCLDQVTRALPIFALLTATACAGSSEALRNGEFGIRGREGIENRILIDGSVKNDRVDHYAVLIGAHTELRHRGNLSLAYQVLIEQGYRRENVYILESEGDATFFPTTDVASRATVTRLFDHLRKIVETQDTLLIYVTGHGRRVTATSESDGKAATVGVSTLVLNSREELADWELAAMLEGLEPAAGIAFFDQCYGAIFATITRACNFVFITTAAEDETSYGVAFPRAFWAAFRMPPPVGTMTSVLTAYRHAERVDRGTQLGYNQPQISQTCNADPARLTLLGVPPTEPTVLSANEVPASGDLLDQVER
jgi:hypothetical protein